MFTSTRRSFLKISAAASAGLASGKSWLWAEAAPARAWTTSKSKKFEAVNVTASSSAGGGSSSAIRVDPAQRFQEILGFGAALTDASCYLFNKMKPADRAALMSDLFGSNGLRFSVARTCVGASDYSASVYSFDDGPDPDPDLKRFTIEHDRTYILPTLRAARELNPELFFFSAPWSPPGWMKPGGSMLGGSMRKAYFAPYADYLVRFVQAYAAEGVKIAAITSQNEVDTDQDARMPAALWGQEYEIDFIKKYLGPAFEKAGLGTKIWILDHNYNLWGRAVDELSDPDLNKYVDGVAWHGYVGTPDAMTRVKQAFPAKHAYWTEGGPDISEPTYATDWTKWSRAFTAILRNWARCIVSWNILLDENGAPNVGPFRAGGVVTINSKTGELTRSGQYWTFAHYSKAIQRGAHVIASQGDIDGVDHIAFENPDGTHAVVITSQKEQPSLQCQVGGRSFSLAVDPDSVTTLVI
jgi:glucosylceramidase